MLIILGCGGTGRTAGGVLESTKKSYAYLDDAKAKTTVNGKKVLGKISDYKKFKSAKILCGYGTTYMKERKAIFAELKSAGFKFFNAIHKNAAIDRTALIGEGNMISANCVLNPNSKLGNNNAICVACTIDHDVIIGNNTYLSPGVNIAGGAEIKDGVFIGTNATILPLVKIGENSIVGAGAVVLHDVPANVTVAGVPAKILKK